MSDTPLDKLGSLLDRVQRNRQEPRPRSAGLGFGSTQAAAPANSQNVPHAATAATAPRPPEAARPRLATPAEAAPPPPPRRPPASPLEQALAVEVQREVPQMPSAPPPPLPAAEPRPPQAVSRRPSPIEAVAPDAIVPRLIDPDPPREVARPIAQLVSKHAPAADATFGAMLKRSLSLRPH
jgi:hypothetical protein